ncbi:MAG: hypothetical protein COV52_03960 [Gammaproteobacteria bacterium CG11_big_fil_rev_8_21_14_0_20_46_22]|nr:MAG: hypothetical protein COW05_10195 [Gammaproteobacteria bacterium CG12_big_fil_rev_8_21_14_0_65_46_12]PIR11475.1 MAG: hypothetical protein COV52_03960 [Gammaproteobacteria bacterium CG11_big_fil_rev_8_21_14_0_20_46_22]
MRLPYLARPLRRACSLGYAHALIARQGEASPNPFCTRPVPTVCLSGLIKKGAKNGFEKLIQTYS